MTVAEYIKLLQASPQDAQVVSDNEGLYYVEAPFTREVHVEQDDKGDPWIKEHSSGGASTVDILSYCPTCGEYAAESQTPVITVVVQVT